MNCPKCGTACEAQAINQTSFKQKQQGHGCLWTFLFGIWYFVWIVFKWIFKALFWLLAVMFWYIFYGLSFMWLWKKPANWSLPEFLKTFWQRKGVTHNTVKTVWLCPHCGWNSEA
jgi:predicted RNA-binding Zn-ribbon protein involved in translation (DUF1610 family)